MQSVQLSTTAYIHAGQAFEFSGAGTLAGGGNVVFLGRTGALPVHFHAFEVKVSKGPVLIELIEAPTVSNVGTPQLPFNRSRQSPEKSDMLISTAAIISGGTILATRKVHDIGGGAHTEGGEAGINGEWVLKANSVYAFRITNLDGAAACDFSSIFFYYELEA